MHCAASAIAELLVMLMAMTDNNNYNWAKHVVTVYVVP